MTTCTLLQYENGWRARTRQIGRLVFGDRVGLAIWLGLVVVLALTWRVGFFIQDSYTIANTLLNVAHGHLAITEVPYSLTLGSQPGLHESGGKLYGRNYGQVILALPVVWALEATSSVVPLYLVLASGWSVAILGFFRQVATVVERRSLRVVGSAIALGGFAINAIGGRPLDPSLLHLAALQLSTIAAAAFAGVAFYRLVDVFHSRRVAVAAGVAVVVALPLGFWASIPKRHVLVSMLLVAGVYCFARSRTSTGRSEYVALAGAYVFVSLVAWIHAFEGFFALTSLGSVDLATGGVRDRKRVAVIAGALLVGLTPMMLTNVMISGNPLEAPRLLPAHGAGGVELAPGGGVDSPSTGTTNPAMGGHAGEGADTSGSGSGGMGDSRPGSGSTGNRGGGGIDPEAFVAPLFTPLQRFLATVDYAIGFVLTTVTDGIAVLGDGDRLWHIFGRSGNVPGLRYDINQFEVIDLTVLESAPLLAGLLTLPAFVARRVTVPNRPALQKLAPWRFTPRRQVDLLVGALGCLLTVVYLSRLPLFSQVTVRYLVCAMPFWLYGLVRLAPVREAVDSMPTLVGTVFGGTMIGGVGAFTAVLAGLNVALGEAMQFHALVDLGLATVVVLLLAGRTFFPDRVSVRSLAIGLASTAGLTAAFFTLAGVEYFQYGPYALAIGRHLSALIPIF